MKDWKLNSNTECEVDVDVEVVESAMWHAIMVSDRNSICASSTPSSDQNLVEEIAQMPVVKSTRCRARQSFYHLS